MMMMAEKEELGLSLSLTSLSQHHQHRSNTLSNNPHSHKLPWIDAFSPCDHHRNSESYHNSGAPLFLRGLDVNRLPNIGCRPGDDEEEPGVSSPNSTLSSVSGKRSEREIDHVVEETERSSSRGISDEEDGENSRKKLRLSKDQSAVLEESFMEHNTLNPKQKLALAKQLGLRPRQVEVWFQNRRARTKLKQTEIDCEFLKRCCENLTEENRRLHKEVQELRAIKLSPQFYMQMNPPTTLTMCPSCERVVVPPSASASSALDTAMPFAMTSGHHLHMPGNTRAHTGPVARSAALNQGP